MGLPPVLVGLVLLLLLWRAGPFGGLGLTFTPTAMVIAQTVLAGPVAAGVTLAAVEGLPESAREQLAAMRLPYLTGARLSLVETRSGVVAAAVAAFGRVIGEVGAVLVIGGNILGETRVLTTLIVQESRQGRFGIAIAAGIVLLLLALAVNVGFERLRRA
jgi:tungstate transport system permease protein